MMNHFKCIAVSVFLSVGALALSAEKRPVELQVQLDAPFRLVAYGDTRFTDPSDTKASNAAVRRTLVQAIDAERPAFISIGGDIVYNGDDRNDWKIWDAETSIWRQHKIPVYPALGNHDLKGNLQLALANYFQRFPELESNRYYSVRAGNTLMLVLDSALDEVTGPQGQWLLAKLEHLPAEVEFVFFVLHHPPYTSLSSWNFLMGGHGGRNSEEALAKALEARQQHAKARFVVFSGHVHNYERHEHNGVTYFVTGGGGAAAYPIPRASSDPYQDHRINYHYLVVEVGRGKTQVTMKRLEFSGGNATWTQPDFVKIAVPALAPAVAPQAQQPAASDPWTTEQTVQPADLVRELSGAKDKKPTVVYVGFRTLFLGGHIPGATFHGTPSTPQGLADLKKWAESLPRDTNLVVYCGCCPLDRCPNLRPGFTALRGMGFTRLRALILPKNFASDWIEKGYPSEKGDQPALGH